MSISRVLQLAFCFGGALLLAGLSVWQVQRLTWKEGLIAAAEARASAAPVAAETLRGQTAEELNFVAAAVSGQPMDKPVQLLHSVKDIGVGFRYAYPYVQDDGAVIFVDLGYIPDYNNARQDLPPETERVSPASEPAPIRGVLRRFTDRGWLTPANNVDENFWFAADLEEMADYVGAPLALPVMLVATDPSPGRFPLRTPARADLPNNHLNYAVTWFGLAVAWLIASVVWMRRGGRPDDA